MTDTTMNTGAASLLPCPMCGAAPKLIVGYSPLNHAFVDCDCGMQTALKDTGEEVTAMWNRRSPTPQADAAIAAGGAQEPVAWMTKSDGYVFYGYNKPDRVEEELVPLYAASLPRVAATVMPDDTSAFKNFHRQLCERFGYVHDEKDWRRDQVSLIEWIAKRLAPAAPSVEQDERGAHLQLLDEVLDAKSVMLAAGCKQATFGEMFAEYARAASTSANVAQGAEAVALTEDQRQILEGCKNYHFRRCTEGDFHLRIVAVVNQILAAPPAQTALTDDARDAARYRFLRAGFGDMGPEVDMHNAFVDGGEVMDRTIDAAMTAAQSASGDTK